jgi:hypothetical protein
MSLNKAMLPRYGIDPVLEINPEETNQWRSGEKMFHLDSKLRTEGLDVIAPPNVYLFQRGFSRIYRPELFTQERGPVHLVFGADDQSTYTSVIRERDVQEDGKIVLANVQYIGALETLKLITKIQKSNVAHIEKFQRLQGDYPLAPERPPKINFRSLIYIVMGFEKSLVPMYDRLLHFGVHKLTKDYPDLEFDVGFFHQNFGFPYSGELDQDKAGLLISGVLRWISGETVYKTSMDPEFMKEAARQRLGHHFDGLFKGLAQQLVSNWNAEAWRKSLEKR